MAAPPGTAMPVLLPLLGLLLAITGATAESVTFLVSPDTHFTSSGGVPDVAKNARGILSMNGLPGNAFPADSQWKGTVEETIRGVVVPGDLVDDGCNTAPTAPTDPGCADQWNNYTYYFRTLPSPASADGGAAAAAAAQACRWPAFEGCGNHDGGNSTDPKSGLVRRGVIARNRQRAAAKGTAGAANYTTSPNGLHYSWDWGGVHLAMLGVYPGTVGDCAAPGEGSPGNGCCSATGGGICWGWHSPEHSLEFLVSDLEKQDKATPIVLFMHYGMAGFGTPGTVPWAGYSPDFWWSTREARAFAEAIKEYNVVAIVHGHTHACVFYQWDLSNVTGRVCE